MVRGSQSRAVGQQYGANHLAFGIHIEAEVVTGG
jgi:hypothetical protein